MSWTLELFRKWRPFLGTSSILRLRALELRQGRGELTPGHLVDLRPRRPFEGSVRIREQGTDLDTLKEIFIEGVYRQSAEHLQKCETIVDLGANVGLATIYFAGMYPGCRIFSVEAHPDNFACLSHNVRRLVREDRCSLLQAAIWNASGSKLTLGAPNPVAFSGYKVVENGSGSGPAAPSISMTDLLARYEIPFVDLLKVDIEGSEVELFRWDSEWLERVGAIAIEFHGDSRERSGFDAVVARHGFRQIEPSGRHTVLVARQ